MTSKVLTAKMNIARRAATDVCNILNTKDTHDTAIYMKKENEDRRCNAKSLLGILSLVIKEGDKIELSVNNDSRIDYITELLTNYFE